MRAWPDAISLKLHGNRCVAILWKLHCCHCEMQDWCVALQESL